MPLGIILVTFERSVRFVIFVTPLSRKRGFRGLEGPVVPNFRSFFRGGAPDDDLRPFVVLFQPTGSPWGSILAPAGLHFAVFLRTPFLEAVPVVFSPVLAVWAWPLGAKAQPCQGWALFSYA